MTQPGSDERAQPRETDPNLHQMLRDAGFVVTEAGRERWRRQLATPIPAEALAEADELSDQAPGRAA